MRRDVGHVAWLVRDAVAKQRSIDDPLPGEIVGPIGKLPVAIPASGDADFRRRIGCDDIVTGLCKTGGERFGTNSEPEAPGRASADFLGQPVVDVYPLPVFPVELDS